MTATELAPAEARDLVRRGTPYGDVFDRLSEADRAAFARWYVSEPGVPNLSARAGRQQRAASGDLCPRCGGIMVRTGTCSTCQSCGESSGGCG